MTPRPQPLLVNISPLPNRRNGIADYAAIVLERLSEHYRCLCVVDEVDTVDPGIRRFAEVLSHRDYAALAPDLRGERHLYHIGNNVDAVSAIDDLARVPGAVMVHDLTLHYAMERWVETRFSAAETMIDVVEMLHGPQAADMVRMRRACAAHKVPILAPYFEATCLPFLNDVASAIITHSAYGQVQLHAAGYRGPIHVIPHFAEVPTEKAREALRRNWRKRLRLEEGTLLFASLGFVTPNKQIPKMLEALAQLPPEAGDWRYVIGGEDRDPMVARTLARLGLEDRVLRMDYLDEQDFDGLLAAADLMINLRFPTSGETSGAVCRALGYALPCVVSNHGWYAELPDETCFRVSPTAEITPELRQVLLHALLDPARLRAKATAARTYAETYLALDQVVPAYCAAIEAAHAAQRGDATGAGADPRGEMLLLPEAPLFSGPLAPDAMLRHLLAAECATVDGRPTRHVALPGQCAVPLAMTGAGGPVKQLFAVIEQGRPFLGRLFAALGAAHDRLATGDLLTLALLCDRPDGEGVDLEAIPLRGTLEAALQSFGFAALRVQEHQADPETAGAPYGRIVIATMRKATDTPPAPGLFLSALGPSTFPSSAVSDKR